MLRRRPFMLHIFFNKVGDFFNKAMVNIADNTAVV